MRIFVLIIALLASAQDSTAQILLDITKQEVSCAGMQDGRAIVVAEGGQGPYQYLWSTGSTEQVINDLAPGTYTVTVTDTAGNTAMDATGLLDVQAINLTLNNIDGTCGKLGEASVSISGGVGPFQFAWSNGETAREIENLMQGTYLVTVTDRNACPLVDSIAVMVNGDSIRIESDFAIPSCSGDTDGYIAINQTGGVLPIEYTWSNGATGSSVENIPAGTYSVFLEDADGCTDGLVIILSDPDLLSVSLINQNDALFALVDGGTPDYDYLWSTGESGTSSINNLDAGDYSLTVEDALGCTTIGTGEVLGPLNLSLLDGLEKFDIFPTLTKQELNVNIQLESTEEVHLTIISPIGNKIWEEKINALDYNASISFPKNWTNGLYFLVLQGSSGWSTYKRFIKTN